MLTVTDFIQILYKLVYFVIALSNDNFLDNERSNFSFFFLLIISIINFTILSNNQIVFAFLGIIIVIVKVMESKNWKNRKSKNGEKYLKRMEIYNLWLPSSRQKGFFLSLQFLFHISN